MPLTLIWWGFVVAPFVYLGLTLFAIEPQGALSPGDPLIAILAGIGVVQIAAAQVLWVQVRRGNFKGFPSAGGPPTPGAIVVWALDEAPAVRGFVLFILGAPRTVVFGLMAVSLVGLLLNPYWALGEDA